MHKIKSKDMFPFPYRSDEACELGHQARRDYEIHSSTDILCPKCHQKPKECTENGNYVIKCECEYIHVSELHSKLYPQEFNEIKDFIKKAHNELEKNSTTSVTCPKCSKTLTECITGNRYYMKCKCGYIYDSEVHGNRIKERPQEAIDLTDKARAEFYKNGSTTVICPKCHEHPTEHEDEHRYLLQCKCGYICTGEIKL